MDVNVEKCMGESVTSTSLARHLDLKEAYAANIVVLRISDSETQEAEMTFMSVYTHCIARGCRLDPTSGRLALSPHVPS
jgi:hypothetical protein